MGSTTVRSSTMVHFERGPIAVIGRRRDGWIDVAAATVPLTTLADTGEPIAVQIRKWIALWDAAEASYYGVSHHDWLLDLMEASRADLSA